MSGLSLERDVEESVTGYHRIVSVLLVVGTIFVEVAVCRVVDRSIIWERDVPNT